MVLDTETTGLSKRDHIIDIGIATVKNGRVTATFSTLVNPHTKIPRSIMNLTGITDQQLAQAPDIQEILPPLLNEIAVLPILGHNIAFDLGMIDNEAKHIGIQGMEPSQIIDTMALSEAMFPNSYGHSLENLLQRLGIDETEQHRALSDALQTFECYCRLKTMSAPITVDWREAQREKEQTKKARQRKNHNFMRDSYLEFVDTTPRNIKPAGFQLEAFGGEHVSGCYKHQQILNSYGRGAYFWVAVRKSKITTGKYTGYPTISINLDGEQIGFLSPQLMSRHYLHIPDGPVVALAHTVNASDITKKIEVRIELPEPHQPIDLAPYVINT
ncbi:3'-5' exonuclease [Bifidobacterium sp. ESL0682]|uniref:3'-5' exonuclease n=1 Tax=Bifidobacterium sp. ESL0682 TaxID=2983212 RepID=UPI0023F70D08|nr:3'-5' exonuclease [Bifidobacterium sp. ESL0682]WEV42706.1 3'-5' exonuclease [Bifidobacterium sp. ESL0682]